MDSYGNGGTLQTPYHFELAVACPAGKQNYEKLHLAEMDKYLDFWNMMGEETLKHLGVLMYTVSEYVC